MIVETLERDGCKVEIHQEEDDTSYADPRGMTQLGFMFCWHPHYTLGDEQFTQSDFDSILAVAEHLRDERKATVLIPLFLLDHSGISMSTGAPIIGELPSPEDVATHGRFIGDSAGWDTSWVGFICDTPKGLEETGADPDPTNIVTQLLAEVEEYDTYLRGDIYGYVTFDAEDEQTDDSCWGLLGWEYAQEAANEALDNAVASQAKENRERAYWLAREVATNRSPTRGMTCD